MPFSETPAAAAFGHLVDVPTTRRALVHASALPNALASTLRSATRKVECLNSSAISKPPANTAARLEHTEAGLEFGRDECWLVRELGNKPLEAIVLANLADPLARPG
jgi:hypothetical protein